ncbi:MAG: methylmalonyl Co-A mutase-associated GTPase MeaB [Gemmatimonadetes bacterium]|nr:methylmalonyl Co-A mutase-associated GTPase MeaB [Gemmatimonadota bacterium]
MTSARPSRTERHRRLAEHFRAGKRPALARAISMIEGGRPGVADLLQELLLVQPRARRFGITGPPGAGKSSLAAGLATLLRSRGEEVAIVAVDPTSPYSGGALLGDRIRMNDLATDPGIFIRSMATRGSLGGLAATTREAIDLLDAFGFPNIVVETVGVGQTELEIASAADTIAVVLVPESGDGIQAMKAGLMEIADLFVVNKSDRIGADRIVKEIRQALLLRMGLGMHGIPAHHGVDLSGVHRSGGEQGGGAGGADPGKGVVAAGPPDAPRWEIPVLKTSAGRGEGIDAFLERLLAHHRFLTASGTLEERREARARSRIRDVVQRRLLSRARSFLASSPDLSHWVAEVAAGRATAYGVADQVIPAILKDVRGSGRE